MPFCGKCGAEVKRGEKYCYRCGFAQQETKPEASPTGGKAGSGTGTGRPDISMVLVAAIVIALVFFVGAGAAIYLYYPDLIPFGKGEAADPAAGEDRIEEGETEIGSPPAMTGTKAEESAAVVPDRYSAIQEAINSSRTGQIITVKPGTYYENIDFRGKEVTLRSTDPDDPDVVAATILDGSSRGSVVTFKSGEGAGAVLTGFTITGGSGTWEDYTITSYDGERLNFKRQYGGGIFITGSSPTITKNVIRDNRAENAASDELGLGAGIAVLDCSSPLIEGNTITQNYSEGYGGGIAIFYRSHPVIKNNLIEDNRSVDFGGGILVTMMSDPVISGNEISHNSASTCGALYIAHMSGATVVNNLISSNSASLGGGIMVRRTRDVLVEGNTFSHNQAKKNGGAMVINYRGTATVRDNVFENNIAGAKGGAIWVSKDSRIQNSSGDNSYRNNSPDNVYKK